MKAEDAALGLMIKYKGWGQHRFVFWSGGKDSTVALHLALRVWNPQDFEVVFIDTGITLPETLEYIEKLAQDWNLPLTIIKPEIDFWEYVADNGFPIITALWCRRLLKKKPIKEFYKKYPCWKLQVLGIRKAESVTRSKSPWYQKSMQRHGKLKFVYELNPLLEWSDFELENYIRRNKIHVNPSYKIYGHAECYFCPFVQNKQAYLNLKQRHPELFNKIVQAERVWRQGKTPWPHKSIIPLLKQQLLEVEKK